MKFTVEDSERGKRIDVFVAEKTELSRSAAARLIENGSVTVNGCKVAKRYEISRGEEIEITLPEPEISEIVAENIPLDIVFEDDDIIVINKPSGMVVHPAPGNYTGTLVNALLYHSGSSLSGIGGVIRPGIVHRIDKDTSGLLVVAKNDFAHTALSAELEHHGIVREYHALARGGFKEDSGRVDMPIGRHPVDRKKMAAFKEPSDSAKPAVTNYEVIARYSDVTYLRLFLETGRTHQIRVHMSSLGHPLLGDEVYSSNKIRFEREHAPLFDGQALHAKSLTLTHPRTKERMRFESELPDNFKKLISILEKRQNYD